MLYGWNLSSMKQLRRNKVCIFVIFVGEVVIVTYTIKWSRTCSPQKKRDCSNSDWFRMHHDSIIPVEKNKIFDDQSRYDEY